MESMTILEAAVWLATLFDAAVGVIVLWLLNRRGLRRSVPTSLGLRHVAAALTTAVGCCCLIALAGVASGRLSAFGLIRLGYFNLAIVPAIMSLYLLGLTMRRNPARTGRRIRTAGLLLLAPAAACAYASFVEPYRLITERVDVPLACLDTDAEPIRIAVLADIQTDRITDHERSAVARALASEPDLIVLPGDFFQGSERRFNVILPQYRELLGSLAAPGGVFACEGNIDRRERLRRLLEDSPVCRLDNDVAVVSVRGQRLAVGGVEWNCDSLASRQVFQTLRDADADVRILLCHTPDGALLSKPDDKIDLVISGHTHGGQIVIPGIGPLLTLARVPNAVAAGGLHRLGHQLLYVSRGVGFERGSVPPMRLFCPPEVSILTLRVK